MQKRESVIVLDDLKSHRDETFLADLEKEANTDSILIPGGLAPLNQPLNRTLNKEMKRQLRAKYTVHIAQAIVDSETSKLPVPAQGVVPR